MSPHIKIMHSCYCKSLDFNIRIGFTGLKPISAGTKSGKSVFQLTHICKLSTTQKEPDKTFATTGNRTRASRVAGENSTTEPTCYPHIQIFHSELLDERVTNIVFVKIIHRDCCRRFRDEISVARCVFATARLTFCVNMFI